MDVNVTATIGTELYLTKVTTGNHEIIVDEPIDKGGKDLAPKPTELLAASLASCTAITLKMYAERKTWDVGEIFVDVTLVDSDDKTKTTLNRSIRFSKTDIPEDQMKRFQHIANACPVHKILEGSITINSEFK
ncbi:putative redox protein [Soonwooa buanensis]|uniref:Putative redox protein n=1 Tax=Soonwooa buanensis TaxID=619805 RepID=A0A1T5CTF8_9FLAO|nr:OsmC family protein [Soonwooa buanensis]SKB62601.1 putative redox protein [Soonwooa buanensis]